MGSCWQEQLRPGAALLTLVQEATSALVVMDTDRLEELARCCADLNRDSQEESTLLVSNGATDKAAESLDVLRRILVETRANLVVLSRLHVIRLREERGRGAAKSSLVHAVHRHTSTGDFYGDN